MGVFFLMQQWFVVLESSFNAEAGHAQAYASLSITRAEWLGDLRRQQNLSNVAGTDTGGHCNSLRRVGN